MKQNIAHLSLL